MLEFRVIFPNVLHFIFKAMGIKNIIISRKW
jgi:hypothetical protein